MDEKIIKVKDCTIAEAVTCHTGESVVDVARKIRDKITRYILVLDDNEFPVGIISTVDMNNKIIAEEKDPKSMTAKDIMSSPIATCDEEEELEDAYLRMVTGSKMMIPVVGEKKLKGLLTLNESINKLTKKMQALSPEKAEEMQKRLMKND